jgi:hypothetical protein
LKTKFPIETVSAVLTDPVDFIRIRNPQSKLDQIGSEKIIYVIRNFAEFVSSIY